MMIGPPVGMPGTKTAPSGSTRPITRRHGEFREHAVAVAQQAAGIIALRGQIKRHLRHRRGAPQQIFAVARLNRNNPRRRGTALSPAQALQIDHRA